MNEYQFPFEKLRVWQEARGLVKQSYALTKRFPASEQYGLTSQLNRATVSVACNLAEGSSRTSLADQAHFSQLAYSSLMEVACLTILSVDNGFLKDEATIPFRKSIDGLAAGINALRQSQLNRSAQAKAAKPSKR